MNKYDDFEESRYGVLEDETVFPSSEADTATSKIDTAAIANASADAINGPNGKDVCQTVRFIACVAGIFGLAWLYEGGHKA